MRAVNVSRDVALVLATSDRTRELGCAHLSRAGYDVLGFSEAEDAQAWLEEETPAFALLAESSDTEYRKILSTLLERDVELRYI